MDLHPDVEHLGFLLGTWRGRGEGSYPTIEDFSYVEEVTYAHVGKPFLSYTQKTRDATSALPLHAETGYLRPVGTERIELVLVQPSGILEIHEGTVGDGSLNLASIQVMTAPTAVEVAEVRRSIAVVDDLIQYSVSMAAVGLALQHHLAGELQRTPATNPA